METPYPGSTPAERWASFRASIQHELVRLGPVEEVGDDEQARFGQRHRVGWKRVQASFRVRVGNRSQYDSKLLREGKPK